MIGEKQRKLRKWFQRHGWHTANTPTGQGFWLDSPVENCAGLGEWGYDEKTGENRDCCKERYLGVELDRFTCDTVSISIYTRRHWWKRDPTAKTDGTEYTWIPSDDFEEWKHQPDASIQLPARDIVKLAELIQAAQEDWLECRPSKEGAGTMTVERRRKMEMENGRQVIGLHNDFSVGGNKFHIVRVENGEAVLENVKTGRKSTYGIQALERVVRQFGYTIKKELLEG